MSLPDTQGAMLCFNNKLDVGEGSRVSRKHLLIMEGYHLHLRSLAPRREGALYFFSGLNIPPAIRVTKRRGTRRSP